MTHHGCRGREADRNVSFERDAARFPVVCCEHKVSACAYCEGFGFAVVDHAGELYEAGVLIVSQIDYLDLRPFTGGTEIEMLPARLFTR